AGLITYYLTQVIILEVPRLCALLIGINYLLFGLQIKLPRRENLYSGLILLILLSGILAIASFHLVSILYPLQAKSMRVGYFSIELVFFSLMNLGLGFFVLYIFYCVFIQEQKLQFSYDHLFIEAWQVILKVFLGLCLVSLTWGLFYLAAFLFMLLDIRLVYDVINSQLFKYLMLPSIFGVGMSLLQHYEAIITKFRNILLAFCQFLYPIFVIINLSFLLVIPFKRNVLVDKTWPVFIHALK
ncbi:MAG: hypothetical protein EBY22_12935, partial [Gammaproteobacteria bacterium]|nr:hypothetical protein [Gammaproteobacteria bacterium]